MSISRFNVSSKFHTTEPFPMRPHAALPCLQNFFLVPHKGSGYSATSANHTETVHGDRKPASIHVKGPPLNHAFEIIQEHVGVGQQPHLVRRTLSRDLSGTFVFFLHFSIFEQEGFDTDDLVHLSQFYTSDSINVPCCHVPTLGTRMKHGGS